MGLIRQFTIDKKMIAYGRNVSKPQQIIVLRWYHERLVVTGENYEQPMSDDWIYLIRVDLHPPTR